MCKLLQGRESLALGLASQPSDGGLAEAPILSLPEGWQVRDSARFAVIRKGGRESPALPISKTKMLLRMGLTHFSLPTLPNK